MSFRKTTRRTVSMLLCVLLLCGILPPVFASGESGTIISAGMEVGSAQAQVSCTAPGDATVIAALYEADTGRMLSVGTANVSAGSGTVSVQMSQARQEGAFLQVFLADRESGAPLAPCYPGTISVGDVGSTITFGCYEQDNDLSNGAEPIEWRVLAVENGRALLISAYGLDARPYNDSDTSVTWETCSLRQWLNGEFYNTAFNDSEKIAIAQTMVQAEDNPTYGTKAGSDTADRIFLLSMSEAERLFADDDERMCTPTAYAIAQGCWQETRYKPEGTCWWWLRSPGYNSKYAALVRASGIVDASGIFAGNIYYSSNGMVRPALWVYLNH